MTAIQNTIRHLEIDVWILYYKGRKSETWFRKFSIMQTDLDSFLTSWYMWGFYLSFWSNIIPRNLIGVFGVVFKQKCIGGFLLIFTKFTSIVILFFESSISKYWKKTVTRHLSSSVIGKVNNMWTTCEQHMNNIWTTTEL